MPAHHSHCLAHSNLYIRSYDCVLLGLIAWALHVSTVLLSFHALGAVAALPPVVPCKITEGTHVAPPPPEIPPPLQIPPPKKGGTIIWPKKLRKSEAPKVQIQNFLYVDVELFWGGVVMSLPPPPPNMGGNHRPTSRGRYHAQVSQERHKTIGNPCYTCAVNLVSFQDSEK